MKTLLIGILALGSISSFASEGNCTFFLATDVASNRIVKILNDKGYTEVINEANAKYRVAAYQHDTYREEGFVAGLEIVEVKPEIIRPYFFESQNYSHWFGASLAPGLKKLERTLPSCN